MNGSPQTFWSPRGFETLKQLPALPFYRPLQWETIKSDRHHHQKMKRGGRSGGLVSGKVSSLTQERLATPQIIHQRDRGGECEDLQTRQRSHLPLLMVLQPSVAREEISIKTSW